MEFNITMMLRVTRTHGNFQETFLVIATVEKMDSVIAVTPATYR